ncbi:hypothetical protein M427DRAFT_46014 [Gonapodya prolifera JEL478]|uniref:Uncharacterized protein n=1 Tax=Gonapodya prolifera (strain JEL478) TaxID=1344416 RepID=A0A139A8X3_GONPJ|nr:hypothetical protein M427DRAFT_46014 [Gonapodya prolifera JEL478]|eukprot:KXS12915.1 hypothetical protein M427DRAFT_46014 [Gonapodya prolifera JEL478]
MKFQNPTNPNHPLLERLPSNGSPSHSLPVPANETPVLSVIGPQIKVVFLQSTHMATQHERISSSPKSTPYIEELREHDEMPRDETPALQPTRHWEKTRNAGDTRNSATQASSPRVSTTKSATRSSATRSFIMSLPIPRQPSLTVQMMFFTGATRSPPPVIRGGWHSPAAAPQYDDPDELAELGIEILAEDENRSLMESGTTGGRVSARDHIRDSRYTASPGQEIPAKIDAVPVGWSSLNSSWGPIQQGLGAHARVSAFDRMPVHRPPPGLTTVNPGKVADLSSLSTQNTRMRRQEVFKSELEGRVEVQPKNSPSHFRDFVDRTSLLPSYVSTCTNVPDRNISVYDEPNLRDQGWNEEPFTLIGEALEKNQREYTRSASRINDETSRTLGRGSRQEANNDISSFREEQISSSAVDARDPLEEQLGRYGNKPVAVLETEAYDWSERGAHMNHETSSLKTNRICQRPIQAVDRNFDSREDNARKYEDRARTDILDWPTSLLEERLGRYAQSEERSKDHLEERLGRYGSASEQATGPRRDVEDLHFGHPVAKYDEQFHQGGRTYPVAHLPEREEWEESHLPPLRELAHPRALPADGWEDPIQDIHYRGRREVPINGPSFVVRDDWYEVDVDEAVPPKQNDRSSHDKTEGVEVMGVTKTYADMRESREDHFDVKESAEKPKAIDKWRSLAFQPTPEHNPALAAELAADQRNRLLLNPNAGAIFRQSFAYAPKVDGIFQNPEKSATATPASSPPSGRIASQDARESGRTVSQDARVLVGLLPAPTTPPSAKSSPKLSLHSQQSTSTTNSNQEPILAKTRPVELLHDYSLPRRPPQHHPLPSKPRGSPPTEPPSTITRHISEANYRPALRNQESTGRGRGFAQPDSRPGNSKGGKRVVVDTRLMGFFPPPPQRLSIAPQVWFVMVYKQGTSAELPGEFSHRLSLLEDKYGISDAEKNAAFTTFREYFDRDS